MNDDHATLSDKVWVVDDDQSIRWVLERALANAGIPITTFASADHALQHLRDERPSAIITDVRMPGMDGLDFIAHIHDRYPELPVIVMTAHSDLDSAVNAYRSGAFEYLPKPFDVDDAIAIVQRAIKTNEEAAPVRSEPALDKEIIGQDPAMQEVFRAIGRLANSNVTVLIRGASGSGKELVAKALHRHSPRADASFVALNMAAIPRELVESELFGHEKGAFTGANSRRIGRFEQANGGTLFLDEIGDMPLPLQTRLLRVLAEGDYYRVGGHDLLQADVRIIAATHQDLEAKIAQGSFREDLFHRLNVINISLPSLRERAEDIPLLARHFLKQAAVDMGLEEKRLRPETLEILRKMPWPGNVRQLQNLCQHICVMAPGEQIFPQDLPAESLKNPAQAVPGGWPEALSLWARDAITSGKPDLMSEARQQLEDVMFSCALEHTNGRRMDAAKLLGVGRNTLTRKLKERG
jgi:two-component system nitrogen regulation response regulator GlnG